MAFFVIFTLPKPIIMKTKILAVALLAIVLYSCGGSKSTTPVVEPKKVELSADLAEGKSLYENNCAKCHKLYDTKDFTKEQWQPIVLRMQKKARISDEQREKIFNYITMN